MIVYVEGRDDRRSGWTHVNGDFLEIRQMGGKECVPQFEEIRVGWVLDFNGPPWKPSHSYHFSAHFDFVLRSHKRKWQ
jgi:hypothetical protein